MKLSEIGCEFKITRRSVFCMTDQDLDVRPLRKHKVQKLADCQTFLKYTVLISL